MNRNLRTTLLEREEHLWRMLEYYTAQAAIWGPTGASAERAVFFTTELAAHYSQYGLL